MMFRFPWLSFEEATGGTNTRTIRLTPRWRWLPRLIRGWRVTIQTNLEKP